MNPLSPNPHHYENSLPDELRYTDSDLALLYISTVSGAQESDSGRHDVPFPLTFDPGEIAIRETAPWVGSENAWRNRTPLPGRISGISDPEENRVDSEDGMTLSEVEIASAVRSLPPPPPAPSPRRRVDIGRAVLWGVSSLNLVLVVFLVALFWGYQRQSVEKTRAVSALNTLRIESDREIRALREKVRAMTAGMPESGEGSVSVETAPSSGDEIVAEEQLAGVFPVSGDPVSGAAVNGRKGPKGLKGRRGPAPLAPLVPETEGASIESMGSIRVRSLSGPSPASTAGGETASAEAEAPPSDAGPSGTSQTPLLDEVLKTPAFVEPPAPLPAEPSFTKAEIAAVVEDLAPALNQCGRGAGRIELTLAVSGRTGRVISAVPVAGSPLAGTPAAKCAARAVTLARFRKLDTERVILRVPLDL